MMIFAYVLKSSKRDSKIHVFLPGFIRLFFIKCGFATFPKLGMGFYELKRLKSTVLRWYYSIIGQNAMLCYATEVTP